MPSIESNRKSFEAAKENGSIVPAVFSDVPKPIPVADYPVSPNPFLRTPLPAAHVQQPDMQRQWQTGATPQTRIVPLAAVSNPNIGAVAQSQAIQVVSTTPSPLAKLVSLNVPSIFTPVSQTEDVNGLLAIALANEAAHTVFAGPSGTVLDEVDAQQAAIGAASPLSVTATPTQPADLALLITATDSSASGFTPTEPAWSAVIQDGSNKKIYSQVTSGTGIVKGSGATDATHPEWTAVLALITGKTGFTPSVINSHIVVSGAFSGQTNAALGFTPTAGNTLLIAIMSISTNAIAGPASVTAFSDSVGDTWQPVSGANEAADSGTQIILYGASNISGGVTTLSFTLDKTLAGASVIALELANVGSPSLPPTFRLLVGGDIPPINLGSNANGGVTGILKVLNGGTGADLSATGGASQVLKQTSSGAVITVAQLAASDLSNGTTGAGSVVLAISPTITGTAALPIVTLSGKVTNYNGIATVSDGVPAEYATSDLTAQSAAIAPTDFYAVPASGAGMYRLSWVAKVTTVATTSSVLGGTNGFQVTYTDKDDSVVVTTPAWWGAGNNGAAPTSASLNTTQTYIGGSFIVNAKASTNIKYLMDYTSVGGTAMQYNFHVKLESL